MTLPRIPIALNSAGVPVEAPEFLRNLTSSLSPLGYVQVELEVGIVIEPTIPDGTRLVLIRIEGAPVRYRDDGPSPTASMGMPLDVGESLTYDAQTSGIWLIAQSEGAIVNMAFYGDAD